LTSSNRNGPWWDPPESYAAKVLTFAENSGRPPVFVAPQDWPCEIGVRQRTGMTVREHQHRTLANYLFLVRELPVPRPGVAMAQVGSHFARVGRWRLSRS
jgi:hypothetical protein